MQGLKNSKEYLQIDISLAVQSNTMKLYKMIWYLSVLPALKVEDPSYESLIPLINKGYSVQN